MIKSFIKSFLHFFTCLAIWNILSLFWEEENSSFHKLVQGLGSELSKMIIVALVVSIIYEFFWNVLKNKKQ